MASAVTVRPPQTGLDIMRKHAKARGDRKYGDKRKAATAHNHAKKPARHAALIGHMRARTEALLGTDVKVRMPGYVNAMGGNVAAVLHKGDAGYPVGAKRKAGAFLLVRTNAGDRVVSRTASSSSRKQRNGRYQGLRHRSQH